MSEKDKSKAGYGGNPAALIPHVARGFFVNFSGIIARLVIMYAFTFVLARMLSQDDLGEFFLMSSVVNLLALFATFGMGMAVVRYVALYVGEKNYIQVRRVVSTGLIVGVSVAIVVTVVLVIAAPLLVDWLFDGDQSAIAGLRMFAIAIPLLVAARIFNATTQGMHQMRYQVYSRDLGEQMSKLVLSVGVLVSGLGLMGIIAANVASIMIALVMSLLFALWVLPKSDGMGTAVSHPARSMVIYALPLIISNVIVAVQFRVDTLLLGGLAYTAQVGFYGVALKVSTFSNKVDTAFGTVFSPVISDLWNRGKLTELNSLFKTVTRWIFITSLPIFLVFLVFSEPIMGLFGDKFKIAGNALIILSVGQLVAASTGNVGLMVLMSGRSWLEGINVFAGLSADVVLCFLLIPEYGFNGAAVANMAAFTIINIMRALEVWLLMRMHAYDRSYIRPIVFGIGSAAATAFLYHIVLDGAGALVTIALVVMMLTVYGIAVATGLSEEDKVVIGMVKSRVSRAQSG